MARWSKQWSSKLKVPGWIPQDSIYFQVFFPPPPPLFFPQVIFSFFFFSFLPSFFLIHFLSNFTFFNFLFYSDLKYCICMYVHLLLVSGERKIPLQAVVYLIDFENINFGLQNDIPTNMAVHPYYNSSYI